MKCANKEKRRVAQAQGRQAYWAFSASLRFGVVALFCLGVLGVVCLTPRSAKAGDPSESGFGPSPFYAAQGHIDYVAAGASTRVSPAPGQTEPLTVNVAGIPAGAQIVRAWANWSYLSDAAGFSPLEANISINGAPVSGELTGSAAPDLCWDRGYTKAYTADVTDLITGDGAYVIANATDHPQPGTRALGEGISILAVYEDPALPLNQVNVYQGMTTTTVPGSDIGTAQGDMSLALGTYLGGPAHFFLNGLDAQSILSSGDDFYVNGQPASHLSGLGGAGNAWSGDFPGRAPGQAFYDHVEADIADYLTPGDAGLNFTTDGFADCVGHSFGALTVAIPEPAGLVIWMALALWSAGRRK